MLSPRLSEMTTLVPTCWLACRTAFGTTPDRAWLLGEKWP
jgi:hypothetical protein